VWNQEQISKIGVKKNSFSLLESEILFHKFKLLIKNVTPWCRSPGEERIKLRDGRSNSTQDDHRSLSLTWVGDVSIFCSWVFRKRSKWAKYLGSQNSSRKIKVILLIINSSGKKCYYNLISEDSKTFMDDWVVFVFSQQVMKILRHLKVQPNVSVKHVIRKGWPDETKRLG